MLTNYNEFRDLCHKTSHDCGWWSRSERYVPKPSEVQPGLSIRFGDPDRLNIPTKIALIHTEVREAHDFYFSGENDDHLPHLPGAAVELGDVNIRVADTAGYLQIDMDAAIEQVRGEFYVNGQGYVLWTVPGEEFPTVWQGTEAILQLHNFAADATEAFRRGKTDEFARSLARIIVLCDLICERNEWDLLTISREKVAYNATRADHKAEARAAAGGKVI